MVTTTRKIEPLRISSLMILEFLKISEFNMTRTGKLNIITGKNEVGKSAILEAIKEAFVSSGVQPHLIHDDGNKAEIMIQLSDGLEINRKLTPTTNVVKAKMGDQPISRPTEYLKSLLGGGLLFDPTVFFLASMKEQRRMILESISFTLNADVLSEYLKKAKCDPKLVDLDRYDFSLHGLEVIAAIRKDIYDRRHEQGYEVLRIKKSIEQDECDMPDTFDKKKFTGFDLNGKLDELRNAQETQSAHEQDKERLEYLRNGNKQIKTEIKSKQESIQQKLHEIEQLRDQIAGLEKTTENTKEIGLTLIQKIEDYQAPDIDGIQADINEYHQSQKLINRLEEIERKKKELESVESHHKELDNLHQKLVEDIPALVLKKVKLPIKNLSITDDAVMVGKIPLNQLSTSQKIRFAVRMARPLAGKLKVICADQVESLDPDTLKAFLDECKGDGFQYYISRVTKGPLKVETDEGTETQESPEKPTQIEAGF